jgi:hypothetical protein
VTDVRILVRDCRQTLQQVKNGSVQCCVTSPPRWGTPSRLPADHPDAGRTVGTEPSPYQYVVELTKILQIVRFKLRDDGTVWLHLSDFQLRRNAQGDPFGRPGGLFGLPWRVANRLQADGWMVVADLAVRTLADRRQSLAPGSASVQEHLFLLAKSDRFYCSAAQIVTPLLRDLFVHECIELGSRPHDTVLDCFGGTGQTAVTGHAAVRDVVLCELSPERVRVAQERFGFVERTG